ncbi:MAG: DUF1269 domain-containing protein [Chloroflexota bacterium]
MSDLIVIMFDAEADAAAALATIREAERAGGIRLTDTAVITKDGSGETRVRNEISSDAESGAVIGAVLGLILPGIGSVIGAAAGAFLGSKMGDGAVDGGFARDVATALAPGTSALFLMIEGGDPAALAGALEPYEGRVYQTSLPPDFEAELNRALR